MATNPSDQDLRGKLVVLLGGSGFVGTHLAQELLARGARLRVACRHPERAYALKPLGSLGQVQFAACDVTKPSTVERVLTGADAVVNCVGAFGGNLDAIQGKGAGRIAAAAAAAGATAFVHVSANGADAESSTAYARTKAEGEAAVLAAFPKATILRPSVIFGPDDNFVNMFARLIARMPAMPVFAPEAKLQPVFIDDVALAIAAAVADPAQHGGKTYVLAGPETMSVLDLNQRIAKAQCRDASFAPLPDVISGLIAAFGFLPFAPITRDQWVLLKGGNTAPDKAAGFKQLGIAPRPLGLYLDRWMVQYRKHGRFYEKSAV